jgi:hypothetical protein
MARRAPTLHRDVDPRISARRHQPPHASGAAVADRSIRAAREHRCHFARQRTRGLMSGAVDAAVDGVEAPGRESVLDLVSGDAGAH